MVPASSRRERTAGGEEALGLGVPGAVALGEVAGELGCALDQAAVGSQPREPQVAPPGLSCPEQLALASQQGSLQLALRNMMDTSRVKTFGTRTSALASRVIRPGLYYRRTTTAKWYKAAERSLYAMSSLKEQLGSGEKRQQRPTSVVRRFLG